MCILILKPTGTEVSKDRLKICFENNPDGAGFSYVNTDHLGIQKMITYKSMEFNPFYEKLRRAERNNPESNFIIHFRIGTSGEKTTHNCHPFNVNDELVFAHNGIITAARKDPDGKDNDTRMFNRDILQELPSNFLYSDAVALLIEEYIGFSKLVFLDIKNNYAIMNEDRGDWIDDVWYSNSTYKERPVYRKYTPPAKVLPKVTKRVTSMSTIECDYCSQECLVMDMKPYNSYGCIEGYCKTCEKMLLENNVILSAEKSILYSFIQSLNNDGPTRINFTEQ